MGKSKVEDERERVSMELLNELEQGPWELQEDYVADEFVDWVGVKHRRTWSCAVLRPPNSRTATLFSRSNLGYTAVDVTGFLLGLQVAVEIWRSMGRQDMDLPIPHAGLREWVWVSEEAKDAVQWI